MDLTTLEAMSPWDWPTDTKDALLGALRSEGGDETDRRLAAELAGEFVMMDDEIVDALLAVVSATDESETLRGNAAISLGPALEQADLEGFGDPDDLVISERFEASKIRFWNRWRARTKTSSTKRCMRPDVGRSTRPGHT
ncbi:MAG: hypothetical protein WD795_20570 [Woeseia sp.]